MQSLNIARNQIGNEGTKKICEALCINKWLTVLDISENHINSDEACTIV